MFSLLLSLRCWPSLMPSRVLLLASHPLTNFVLISISLSFIPSLASFIPLVWHSLAALSFVSPSFPCPRANIVLCHSCLVLLGPLALLLPAILLFCTSLQYGNLKLPFLILSSGQTTTLLNMRVRSHN